MPIVVLDPDGSLRSEFGAFPTKAFFEGPPNHRPRALELPYAPGTPIAVGSSGIFVGSTDQFEIRRFDPAGSLRGIIRFAISPVPVLGPDVDSILEEEVRAVSGDLAEGVRSLFRIMPTPEFKPPFQQLFVDSLGRLWVRADWSDPTLPGWLVFKANGDLLGSARLPDGEILDLGEGHVVVLTYDEYDAPVISVFELQSISPSS